MFPELFSGSNYTDERGRLDYFNSLDLSEIVRMYRIRPADTTTVRAWQGHRSEKKWFYCLKGAFVVNLIPLTKFGNREPLNKPEIYTLQSGLKEILQIPGGYVNGFRALEPGSELLVFSDMDLESSRKDEIRFDQADRPFVELNDEL